MALKGSFHTSAWTAESGDKVSLLFEWTATQDDEANTSEISWTLKGSRSNKSSWVYAGGFKVVIDGETVYSKSTDHRIKIQDGTLIASGEKTIKHKDDGTRSFSVSAEAGIYYYAVNCTGSETFKLDAIPRASTITCTSADIGSKPTIKITKAASNFTHTIKYKFGDLTGTIATKTTATSITSWPIPESFYAQIPDAKKGEGVLTCITYNGDTKVGEATCKLPVTTSEEKCKPSVSGAVVDTNPVTLALTGNSDILIRYYSTALCAITVELNKDAGSITTKTINNVAGSGNTRSIPKVETGTFDFYAKDSRGYYNSDKVVKDIVPYVELTCNVSGQRTDPASGNATLYIEGNYFDGSFGAVSNSLTVRYRQGEGEYQPVTPTISDNKYSVTVELADLDYTKNFTFEVEVVDKLSTLTKTATIQKGVPVFDWGENDFRFNVPVFLESNAYAAGAFETGLKMWHGYVRITPTEANTVTSETLDFPSGYFTDVPCVVITPRSAVPDLLRYSCIPTRDNVAVYMTRENTTETGFYVFAIGK